MTDWQNKAWGRTRTTHESEFYSRHELEVLAGGYCSVHWHEYRANRFVVVEGAIRVVSLFGWREESIVLTRDNIHDVPSLVPHQFQVIEAGRIVEEYWPDRGGRVDPADIVRLTVGGLNPELVEQAKGAIR